MKINDKLLIKSYTRNNIFYNYDVASIIKINNDTYELNNGDLINKSDLQACNISKYTKKVYVIYTDELEKQLEKQVEQLIKEKIRSRFDQFLSETYLDEKVYLKEVLQKCLDELED